MGVIESHEQTGVSPVDRRRVLGLALGAGVAALLVGCGSTGARRSRVGDPIPDSPQYKPLPRGGTQPRPTQPPVASSGRLNIISRQTWAGAGPIESRANRMGRIEYITVHHDGMAPYTSSQFEDSARRLEAIRKAHVNNTWADIGYHYAIDPAGRIWAARPESIQGAHVKDRNPGNLGIVMLGNYESQRPTDAAIRSIDALVAAKMSEYRIPMNRVLTHREWAATACPGRHLQSHMQLARGNGGSIRVALAQLGAGALA